MSGVSGTVTSEQSAARSWSARWAAGSGGIAAARDVEHGEPEAWRPVYVGLAELGLFGVAVPEEAGGAGASVTDLCAMVEEAAAALVPGPVASSALATLVVDDPAVLEALMSGERTAGLRLVGRSARRRRPGVRCGRVRAGRGGRRCGAVAGSRRLAAGRHGGRRGHRRTAVGDRLLAAAGPRRARRAPATTLSTPRAAGRGSGGDGAGRRGRRVGPVGAGHRRRVREGARAVRQADRQLPGDQAHVRRDAAALRADLGGRGRCRPGRRRRGRRRRCAAFHRRRGRRGHRHRGREGQRQGLHPGARRHRHHLGARRASVSASRIRDFAAPRRPVALAASRRGADPGGCAPQPRRRSELGASTCAPRSTPPSPRSPRCRRISVRPRWPRPGCWRRTGRGPTAATPRRPNSC